jgi:VIT1/CCC1 family predicted Fe2+/Mn2+ transporter
MDHSLKTGFSFGITSGIITTLGLIVGLHAANPTKPVIIGGILTIAIADAFSDALGIHISEESEDKHTAKEIWISTFSTFAAKFIIALTFVIPIFVLPLALAIIVGVLWGLSLLGIFSYYIAKQQKKKTWKVILEHILIALLVIGITHYAGDWIGATFG